MLTTEKLLKRDLLVGRYLRFQVTQDNMRPSKVVK